MKLANLNLYFSVQLENILLKIPPEKKLSIVSSEITKKIQLERKNIANVPIDIGGDSLKELF